MDHDIVMQIIMLPVGFIDNLALCVCVIISQQTYKKLQKSAVTYIKIGISEEYLTFFQTI